jgi:glycosyltransferase involved in cell wall biosynthesis
VSVIVPVYNREKLLPVAAESVLRQTFGDWELLVIDDSSTDGTRQVIEDYAQRDSRVRYHRNGRTKGPSGARNQGIELAAGEFIAFLDSDDEWEPHHLDEMVRYLRKYPGQIDVMSANPIRKLRATGEVYQSAGLDLGRFRHSRLEDAFLLHPTGLFEVALHHAPVTIQTAVIRRALLDRIRFDEELLAGEDILFQLELAYHQAKIAHLPRVHVTYWAHGGNLSCAGGLSDARAKLPVFLAFEQMAVKLPQKFQLSSDQRARLREWLAELYFWYIGYSVYLKNQDPRSARRYFRKALRLQPFRLAFWKTYVLSFVGRSERTKESAEGPGATSDAHQ